MNRVKRYQLVELTKAATMVSSGNQLYFDPQPQLQTQANQVVQVMRIVAFTSIACPFSPAGIAVVTPAEFLKAFLTLNIRGSNEMLNIPLSELNPILPNTAAAGNYVPAAPDYFNLLSVFAVDWQKSYIQFGSAPAALEYSFLLGVTYAYLPNDAAAVNQSLVSTPMNIPPAVSY